MTPHRASHEDGFTVVELLIVVAIIAILVAIAMPVFYATRANAERKACYANQRTLEGAVPTWLAINPEANFVADLAGTVDSSHPMVVADVIASPPRCQSAPKPADALNPTVAEGAYEFTASGDLNPCTHGLLGPHGLYSEQ
jgi:prepilin-type N-terminal cleavage/methylation domain-containing protein